MPATNAITGIDLADSKQLVVVTDHESRVLVRRTFRRRAWELGTALDWAAGRASAAGFAGVTVAVEPTGHRWRVIGQLAAGRDMPFVCVQPLMSSWARRAEDLTFDKTDDKDAVLIACLVAQLAVRRQVARWDAVHPWQKIIDAVFAACSDPAGVTEMRHGALERVALLLADRRDTRARLADTEQRIVTVLGELGLTDLVTSITGLSEVGAASILAETGDPGRFTTGRALVKHAGLAPRQKNSGSYTGRTRTTGQGRPAPAAISPVILGSPARRQSPACISGGCGVRATEGAPLHQRRHLVPVDMAGGSFGRRPGDAQARQPGHAPLVHRVLLLDGLVAYRRQRQFHRFLRPLDLTVDKRHGQFHGRGESSLLFPSSLRTYSMFSIAWLAVFITVAHFQ